MKCPQRLLSLALLLLLSRPSCIQSQVPQEQRCHPCASGGGTYKAMPGTGCKEYVQCSNGDIMDELTCPGDTIFDEGKQYCNWADSVTCVERSWTCSPTKEPTTERPVADCLNPCPVGFNGSKTRPGSRCKIYVSCKNGQVEEEKQCNGDTIFNQNAGYCDWPGLYSCEVFDCPERKPTYLPTLRPTRAAVISGSLFNPQIPVVLVSVPESPVPDIVVESADCPNPCPVGHNGYKTRPGTQCQKYVQCLDGDVAQALTCPDGQIFNANAQYCDRATNLLDWTSSVTLSCSLTPCPERGSEDKPTQSPAATITINVPSTPSVVTIPIYVNGPGTSPDSRPDTQTSTGSGGGSAQTPSVITIPVTVTGPETRPDSGPGTQSGTGNGAGSAQTPSVITIPVTVTGPEARPDSGPGTQTSTGSGSGSGPGISSGSSSSAGPNDDCPNPCPKNYFGLETRPKTNCQIYVQCEDGEVIGEFQCYGENYFMKESGQCESSMINLREDWYCPEVPCPTPGSTDTSPTNLPEGETTIVYVQATPPPVVKTPPFTRQPTPDPIVKMPQPSRLPTPGPTRRPTVDPTPRPTRVPKTRQPTTAKPTPMPTSTYQYFYSYLLEREDRLNEMVFRSNGNPSTAYTYTDFMNSLEISVFQLPADKALFVGEGTSGRLPKLSGVEYGLVNIAAFLSNAMEEGMRIDSCDEWNTDGRGERYPLSNACGQYGRSYGDEECQGDEPYHCAVEKTMEITAVDVNTDENIPPFMCRAKRFNGELEIFPGYYDSFDDVVVESVYASSVGRTDVEGCCYWGRGVLLTRGRCTLGKLDKYLGQGAVDRGVYVYPSIDFCANPEAICNHPMTNQLRWVLGMLEWTDRVQSYDHDELGKWNYMDELKRFVDEGMVDDAFMNGVINIVTRKCHDNDSCEGRWQLDEEYNAFEGNRRDNFRKIIFEVFNLPMTSQPTVSPNKSPTFSPTLIPTEAEETQGPTAVVTNKPTNKLTNKPTRRNGRGNGKVGIKALPPNSAQRWKTWHQLTFVTLLSMQSLIIWT